MHASPRVQVEGCAEASPAIAERHAIPPGIASVHHTSCPQYSPCTTATCERTLALPWTIQTPASEPSSLEVLQIPHSARPVHIGCSLASTGVPEGGAQLSNLTAQVQHGSLVRGHPRCVCLGRRGVQAGPSPRHHRPASSRRARSTLHLAPSTDTIGGVKRASRQSYSDVSPSQQVAGAGAALVLDDPSPRQGEDKKRSRASGSADGTMDAPSACHALCCLECSRGKVVRWPVAPTRRLLLVLRRRRQEFRFALHAADCLQPACRDGWQHLHGSFSCLSQG